MVKRKEKKETKGSWATLLTRETVLKNEQA